MTMLITLWMMTVTRMLLMCREGYRMMTLAQALTLQAPAGMPIIKI